MENSYVTSKVAPLTSRNFKDSSRKWTINILTTLLLELNSKIKGTEADEKSNKPTFRINIQSKHLEYLGYSTINHHSEYGGARDFKQKRLPDRKMVTSLHLELTSKLTGRRPTNNKHTRAKSNSRRLAFSSGPDAFRIRCSIRRTIWREPQAWTSSPNWLQLFH